MRAFAIVGSLALLGCGDPSPEVETLREHGCTGCHSVDGSRLQGPTLAGLAGRERAVIEDDARRLVVADDAYVQRSIREPDAQVVEGFSRGGMPRLSLGDAEVDALATAIAALPAATPPDP